MDEITETEKIENMNASSEADCECPFYKAAAGEVKADSAALLRYKPLKYGKNRSFVPAL